MRILYVARLFSGLEDGLLRGRWEPSGAPTSYKLVEALDRSEHDLHLIFTAKDGTSSWRASNDRRIHVEGLSTDATVLAGRDALPSFVRGRRGSGRLRDLRQAKAIGEMSRGLRPDLVYLGHANLWAAASLARYGSVPVVFRVMGIYPEMRRALDADGIEYAAMRWAYRSPFAAVIATQDGSGIEPWMERALEPTPSRHALLNGVDLPEGEPGTRTALLEDVPRDRTIVLFLGRLQPQKGCRAFIRGFLRAWREQPRLHALVVGDGPERDALEREVREAGAHHAVTFAGTLPHDHIIAAHAASDIYVSLNELGNLSNANLEAMRAGACMVIPRAQPALGIDVVTDRLIPPDAAWRVPHADDAQALAEALITLHHDPERRRSMRDAIAAVARRCIPSWDERVSEEMKILEEIAQRARKSAT